MTLLGMVWKNLFRRPARTLLTLLGIAIGIAAVVALTGFARGLEKVWDNAYKARGTDLVITKITSRSPVPATFDPKVVEGIATGAEIESSAGLLSDLLGIEEASAVLVFGWEYPSFLWEHLKVKEGRLPETGIKQQAVLGALAATTLNKKVGDPVQIEFETFTVVGIVESAALVENGAVILPLADMQRATEREGKVNFLNLRLRNADADVAKVKERIAKSFEGYRALESGEVASQNTGVEVMKAMSWVTSVIALVVGAFGVTNTMLMSVFERTREIGILLAIGWKPRRVMAMILTESIILSLCGGALGSLVGVGFAKLLERNELLLGRLQADTGPFLFVIAFCIALSLGVGAGIFPAWKAATLQPGEALRSE